jgi:hypothetical protein
VDPSGFGWFKSLLKIAGIAINFVSGFQGWGTTLWQSMLKGLVTGFLASGGNFQAGLLGALGGAAFYKVGMINDALLTTLAHGVVSGGLTTLAGGSFKSGFMGGVFGAIEGRVSGRYFGEAGTGGQIGW